MLKLLLGNPYVLLGVGALILLLACGNVTFWALWDGAANGKKAAELSLATMTSDRDAQRDGLATAKASMKRQQDRMDEVDARATAILAQQQQSSRDLAVRLQSATDLKNAAIAQLQEE